MTITMPTPPEMISMRRVLTLLNPWLTLSILAQATFAQELFDEWFELALK